MRTLALLLVAGLVLGASPAHAAETTLHRRGFVSGLGLGLLVGGLAGAGVGTAGLLSANDAALRLAAYQSTATADLGATEALEARKTSSTLLSIIGFTAGGLALAAGVLCLVLDAPSPIVAFVPLQGGGAFVFSGRF